MNREDLQWICCQTFRNPKPQSSIQHKHTHMHRKSPDAILPPAYCGVCCPVHGPISPPTCQASVPFLQSLPLWFWPLIEAIEGSSQTHTHTYTQWMCRIKSGRNMTRSQFINLAHWRNTKSSHSWGERERRGWSGGCGWWRAGIRKTKQCNGKETSCSAFPQAGFAQAQVRPWTVLNGYLSPLISHSLSRKSLPPHTFREREQPPPHTHGLYTGWLRNERMFLITL